MVPGLLGHLSARLRFQLLGRCPACGHDVPASADALRYHGRFYHVGCALRHHERTHARSALPAHAR